jgi:DNA-binding response OmpR family regulator
MKKILAIDDNIIQCNLIKTNLEKKYDVTVRYDGEKAYQWLSEGKNIPDIIICDIDMPEMSGYDFLKKIRNSGFFGDIPVIMLSQKEAPKDRVECYNLKAQDFLAKPFNAEELLALIEKNLNPKIRWRNFELNESDKYHFFKLGALQFIPEEVKFEEAEELFKEKFAELVKQMQG